MKKKEIILFGFSSEFSYPKSVSEPTKEEIEKLQKIISNENFEAVYFDKNNLKIK